MKFILDKQYSIYLTCRSYIYFSQSILLSPIFRLPCEQLQPDLAVQGKDNIAGWSLKMFSWSISHSWRQRICKLSCRSYIYFSQSILLSPIFHLPCEQLQPDLAVQGKDNIAGWSLKMFSWSISHSWRQRICKLSCSYYLWQFCSRVRQFFVCGQVQT